MGIQDALGSIFRGETRTSVPFDLLPQEQELARVVGNSAKLGPLSSVGGHLVLTNLRIIFAPWNTGPIGEILAWGLGKAEAPKVAQQIVNGVQGLIDRSATAARITAVSPGHPGSLFRPPTIRVTTSGAEVMEFGVLADILSPTISAKNVAARDEFLHRARSVLALQTPQ